MEGKIRQDGSDRESHASADAVRYGRNNKRGSMGRLLLVVVVVVLVSE
jgi:hypothetical protein